MLQLAPRKKSPTSIPVEVVEAWLDEHPWKREGHPNYKVKPRRRKVRIYQNPHDILKIEPM